MQFYIRKEGKVTDRNAGKKRRNEGNYNEMKVNAVMHQLPNKRVTSSLTKTELTPVSRTVS
jgi:hypothetical protein